MGHSLEPLFAPTSVVVVGGSSDRDKLGGRPIDFCLRAGFKGSMVVVNARAEGPVQGLPTFRRVADVDRPLDHAIIVAPATHIATALAECGQHGVKVAQILTAGFAEIDEGGKREQDRLLQIARDYGMRILGPNCLGVVSVLNRFYATFSSALVEAYPAPGVLGVATQSGAFGSCAYSLAMQRGIGLSRIVSTGNEADIDVADCLEFLAQDPQTRVVFAALEGCRDGCKLRRALIACAAAHKPVIVMKVGSSDVGAAAAATHTGSLAGDDAVFDTVFAECGAWRAKSIDEMLDIASLLACSPAPANNRAGVITLSGGIGALMADVSDTVGLELPPLPPAIGAEISEFLPFGVMANPLDTTAQINAVPGGWVRALSAVLNGSDWGTVFVYIAQLAASPTSFASTLPLLQSVRNEHPGRCIVLVGPSDDGMRKALEVQGVALVNEPTRAVAAVGAAASLVARRSALRPAAGEAARSVRHALPAVLDERSSKELLSRYGIAILREAVCACVEDAAAAARDIGYPVALKIASPDIRHKTEVGGVLLNIADEAALRGAFAEILSRVRRLAPGARIDGINIAPMANGGVEVILGMHHDPVFGQMMMFGLGGIAVELFNDVVFASAPLDPAAARSMVNRVRSAKLLEGWRGAPAMDKDAIVEALCNLSDFAAEHANDVVGVEINPFLVRPRGGVCLDALIVRREDDVAHQTRSRQGQMEET